MPASTTPSLSIIVPSYPNPTWRLPALLSDLLLQLAADQVLVIGDGPHPEAKAAVEALGDPRIAYHDGPATRSSGNAQRDLGITLASGDYLLFVDDQNFVPPKALARIREAISEDPHPSPRPHFFGLLYCYADGRTNGAGLGFERPCPHVGGSQIVVPNVKGKIGSWTQPHDRRGRYGTIFNFQSGPQPTYYGDQQFISQTMSHYPDGAAFHYDVICLWTQDDPFVTGPPVFAPL